MRKWTLSLTMAMLAVLVLTMPAAAGRKWCAKDPIISFNGRDAQLLVAIPEEYQSLVTGPIDITVSIPNGVTTNVLFLDAGFNGYGEKVTFAPLKNGKVYADGSFDVHIRVQVPINTKSMSKIPLQLTFGVGGTANQTAPDAWEYQGGKHFTIEMTNAGTTLPARFPAANFTYQTSGGGEDDD